MQGDPDGYAGTPRWVKAAGIVLLVLVLLAIGLVALGIGGDHGPGRHLRSTSGEPPADLGHATAGGDHGEASPVAEGALEIEVTADGLAFQPAEITVAAGTDVAIVLTSVDARHDFTLDALGAHVAAERGETSTGGFHAGRPGRYTYYCAEPGHREAGMEGTLVVEGGPHHA